MPESSTTCWTVIDGAARGGQRERDEFAHHYHAVVRAYFRARWSDSPAADHIDDAAQEVFVECFRLGGPLERADRSRPGGFRPFLFGIVRNIARRFEQLRPADRARLPVSEGHFSRVASDETSLTGVFDREWARSILAEAADRHSERAASSGADAVRRVDLLRLRFQDGLPIREIAARWGIDAEKLHREYARARAEFKAALLEVVAFYQPAASPADLERASGELLRALK